MATFPPIEPFRRSWGFADFPMEQEAAWPGIPVRYRTGLSDRLQTNMTLQLTYEDLTEEEAQQIRSHYRAQRGGIVDFDLSPVVWKGGAAIVPDLARWRYSSPPVEEHKRGGRYDITVSLESLPFTGGAVSIALPAVRLLLEAVAPTVTGAEPPQFGVEASLPGPLDLILETPAPRVFTTRPEVLLPALAIELEVLAPTARAGTPEAVVPPLEVLFETPAPRVITAYGPGAVLAACSPAGLEFAAPNPSAFVVAGPGSVLAALPPAEMVFETPAPAVTVT
jgi:hypothetical protein